MREKIINRGVNPLLADLPDWVEGYRGHQVQAINEILAALEDVDVVVLEAPTGAGKTLIAETARRVAAGTMELEDPRAMYVCSSKGLQDQFLRDYPYATVIKGRGNYATEKYPDRFLDVRWTDQLSCDDCTHTRTRECDWCESKQTCPYEVAKTAALRSDLVIANTAYALSEWNYIGKLSGRGFICVDEADTLESQLMNFVSVDITERRMERLGWSPPSKVTVSDSWMQWIEEHLPKLEEKVRRLKNVQDVVKARERKALANLATGLELVRDGIKNDEPWVYTGRGGLQDKQGKAVSFKPVKVDMLGKGMLWRHGEKWLLMSATVISAREMLDSLGWDGDWRYVRCASTFPVKNRPVYPLNVAANTLKQRGTAPKVIADACVKVVAHHPHDRVLIHTVSYDMTRVVADALRDSGRTIATYTGARERDAALELYKSTPGSVLVAPSMDRGVDLPGDLCRVQILTKLPFPYLGDRQINARVHSMGGQVWYQVQTVRAIVQMTGRGVRSVDDWATTYILDSGFQSLIWTRCKALLPDWWRDSVLWGEARSVGRDIGIEGY